MSANAFSARGFCSGFICVASLAAAMAGEGASEKGQGGVIDYTIEAQDVLAVQIMNSGEPVVDVSVAPDGYILFPQLGRVPAAGKTPSELEEVLRKRLADGYYVDPQVVVSVTEYKSKKVLVFGEASSPGEVQVVTSITLVELVTKVGGPAESSDGKVTLVRTGKDVQRQTMTFEITKVMAGTEESAFELKPGDIILFTKFRQNYVFVRGEVKKVGMYPLRDGMTVQQAIIAAGGLSEIGSERKIYVSRVEDGKEVRMKAKTRDRVRNGDTISVRQGWF